MNRPVLIHVFLVAIALVSAYFVWTRDTTTREDEVPVLSIRGDLDRVVYSAPKRNVEIQRKKDNLGPYYWVEVQTEQEKPAPPAPKPDAGTASAPDAGAPAKKAGEKPGPATPTKADAGKPATPQKPPKPKMITTTKNQAFKGNKSVEELVKGLAGLSAVRSLGQVDKAKLKAFELEGSKKTLTLVTDSTPRTFIIGGNTFGNMDVYIQDKQDGRVYVVRPRLLQDLQYAEFRLVDRDLNGFEPADVERAALVAGKQRKVLMQKNRRDPASAFWVDAEAPEKKKDFYRNFMGKLLRLQAMEYVSPAESKKPLTELLSVEFETAGGKREALKLLQGGGPAIAPPGGKPADKEFYAISSNTRQLVKVNPRLADEVARDVDNLMKD